MPKPNVYVAGFPRCGTQYLFEVLKQHPDIDIPAMKEINYFNWTHTFPEFPNYKSPNRKRKLSEYFALFQDKPIKMDFSISSAYDHNAPKRIKEALGDIKIMFLIRDKESHKKSFYKLLMKLGGLKYQQFDQFIEKHKDLVEFYQDFDSNIEFWKKHFSNVAVFNVVNNDMKTETKKICKFLGVRPHEFKLDFRVNTSEGWKPASKKQRIKRRLIISFPFFAKKRFYR